MDCVGIPWRKLSALCVNILEKCGFAGDGARRTRRGIFAPGVSEELTGSRKGRGRICTHGEKEVGREARIRAQGVPANVKALAEMRMIASKPGVDESPCEHIR